jgi:hypothetical protein
MRETAKQPDDPLIVESGFPALYPLSRIQQRLIQSAGEIAQEDPASILYQHTVFCQTGLPYRDPGNDTRLWQRSQGAAHLEVEAGRAFHPERGAFIDIGLPFGPKPRLILAYLNAEALRSGSPVVEVETSLSAFVQRLGLCRDGRSIRAVKDQLTRLATAEIRLAFAIPGMLAKQVQAHIVSGFELWLPKDVRQRVLWPSNVTLSGDYFASLQRHAVPLDERALAALSHNAMALDTYCWLAQRLHRIDPSKPAFIGWAALRDQFGWHYSAMFKFRQVFRQTLDLVCSQYRGARIELDERGLTLCHSSPPVKGRVAFVAKA